MTGNLRLPLRLLVTDPASRFQLPFSDQSALLLAGVAGIEAGASARGLILNALSERDLSAAVAMLQTLFPVLNMEPVEVVHLDEGTMEPYVRVNVKTPADFSGPIVAQLKDRSGLIEGVVDTDSHHQIVSATAPLARMLGYDKVLSDATKGSAAVEYCFLDYRPRRIS